MNHDKNEDALVSVCIPAYNHEKFITEAIISVIKQDYGNIELLIINDGSTDFTHDKINKIIERCKNRFIRFEYINRENKGLSETLNEAINWSKGRYFSVIASDDAMLGNKVSLLLNKLEGLSDDYTVCFGDALFIDDESNVIKLDESGGILIDKNGFNSFLEYYTRNRDFCYKDDDYFGAYSTLLESNYLPAMSYLVRMHALKSSGGWTKGNVVEDWELWLKLSRNSKFAFIDEPVALYRWHENNSHKTLSKKMLYDVLSLLENEKEFALSNGLDDLYYSRLFSLIVGLRRYDFKYFAVKLFKNFRCFKVGMLSKVLKNRFK